MSLTRRADVIVWCETQPSQKLKKRTEGSNCRNRMSALIGKRHFTHPQTRVPDVPRSSNARDLAVEGSQLGALLWVPFSRTGK
jgi:hypothetical protein